MGGLILPSPVAGFINPVATPVFDYDFVRNRLYGPPITVTRSAAAYVEDASGAWTLVAANTLRRSNKGALFEGAQTNLVPYSSDLTQAGWAKTGATAVLNQTGFDGTANSASLLTATAANATALYALTSASSLRTFSIFLRRVTGSGSILITQDGGATWTAVTLTSSWQRFQIPGTLANPTVGVQIATSGDAVAVDVVQNETWASGVTTVGGASSPIRTAGAAVTRPADSLVSTFDAPVTALTFAAVARTAPFPVTNAALAQISINGSSAESLRVRRNGSIGLTARIASGGSVTAALDHPTLGDDVRFAYAVGISPADSASSLNGGALTTTGAPPGIPSFATFNLGAFPMAWTGYIEREVLLPARMVNSEIQRLASLATWGG